MKISKLFHWLYAILMFLPFGLLVYNALASMWSGNVINYDTWLNYGYSVLDGMFYEGLLMDIYDTYKYLVYNIFGLDFDYLVELLSYWTSVSIIWLIFDVIMYVPLLVHRWIDKAKIE